ncbi:MAG: S1/P1 Nuclease [Candidatus Eremiobacteraeota bacterium]|nr:S1/P1 Nuclease [Candidatus Eremiobacteraeota bacterium]
MIVRPIAAACAALLLLPSPALAWGAQGHRIINGAAVRALPASLPAFLRSPAAHDEVALLGPEADRVKGAGPPLDDDENPAHYVDALDDGSIAGVVRLSALPADRKAYERALLAASPSTDGYTQGYLPYEIADGWERIVRDLAYWRVDVVGETKALAADDRAFFAFDRSVRETVTLRDIGYWGHFVADASQPLHVSVHFNGWNGRTTHYPNPEHYTDSTTIHARFETALVRAVANEDLVAARIPAPALSHDAILAQVGAYLQKTESFVPAVYRLEAAGGIDARSPAATSLVLDRLAAGAAEMRDLLVEAWEASGSARVGYPPVPVADIEAGRVLPTRANTGLGD